MPFTPRVAALIALCAVTAPAARAACPSSETILDELTCSSTVSGRLSNTDITDIGGACGAGDCYTCGSPISHQAQAFAEDVYSFTCQASGAVTLEISGLDCDLDIYVLDDSCDPYSGCVEGSTNAYAATDAVTFTCAAGQTYYVVVEGFGFNPAITDAAERCSGSSEGDYTLSFDVSAGTGCSEDCDNGTDDDLDGAVDCDDSDCTGDPVCDLDADNDGYDDAARGGDDCDDADAAVHPGADEWCDGYDNDCDGTIDEADAVDVVTWYRDADTDTYGNPAVSRDACDAPLGYVVNDDDCDDTARMVNPAATEVCDGIDNDCDGRIDEDGDTTWYRDADGDGYGLVTSTTVSCSAPSGYVSNPDDCNDGNAAVNPAATEVCDTIDNDCDGSVDESGGSTYYADVDRDGYGNPTSTVTSCTAPRYYVANDDDCDDTNAAVNPAATELCNDLDDDCDGRIDESGGVVWYADSDSDGYGTTSRTTIACDEPDGYTSNSTDCNDALSSVNPGATEVCDGIDNDCDSAVDESGGSTWYIDADSDNYGDPARTRVSCTEPVGYVADGEDCDDSDRNVHPGATEFCNDVDDDCDELIDEDAWDATTWYTDGDADGYGDPLSTTLDCDEPAGHVRNDDDCWDADATVSPDGTEVADGVDQDCDGVVDEGTEWYDDDGDGWTEDGGDCNDAASGVSPITAEVCNSRDDDCDGVVDEGTECYDDDGDGSTEREGDCNDGDAAVGPDVAEVAENGVDDDCNGAVDDGSYDPDRDGYTADGGDCDDSDASTYPGASEQADGADNDCDGETDEGTVNADDDGDGASEAEGDCNDDDPRIHEGVEDGPDGIDNDCDGMVDEGGPNSDDDGDGFTEDGGDCDDDDPARNPAATESADGVDNNCDDQVDEGFVDVDDDGWAADEGDCDDLNGWVNPGLAEQCDGIDNNCDDAVDEGCGDEDTGKPLDPVGCGCGAAPGVAGAGMMLMGVAALALRRRRT